MCRDTAEVGKGVLVVAYRFVDAEIVIKILLILLRFHSFRTVTPDFTINIV